MGCRPGRDRLVVSLGAIAVALLAGCGSSPTHPADEPVPPDSIPGGVGGGGTPGPDAGGACVRHGPTVQYDVGDVLPELEWTGFASNDGTETQIHLSDFSDPDGSRGINAIYLSEADAACTACEAEAKAIRTRLAAGGSWATLGVAVVQLVWVACDEGGLQTALRWKTENHASWTVAADPILTIGVIGQNKLPEHLLVDPRTMQVTARIEGFDEANPEQPAVDELAQRNLK